MKVFDLEEAARLKGSGLNKGAMVTVSCRATSEPDKYTKDGSNEEIHVARLVAVVESNPGHGIEIETLGRSDGDRE